jgi:prepilin-type N-terminal cleavage/methylation domain-containing protein
VSRRNGFSLIEMLIVVVILGIMAAMVYPRVSQVMAKNDLRSARTTLANNFAMARSLAMQRSRSASVNFNVNNVVVTMSPRMVWLAGSTLDTIGGVQNLNTLYGVTVTAPVASVNYDPRGFAGGPSGLGGALVTFVVSRSGKQDSVSLDYLGRVTK